ncbi:MAG: phage holin family protein [Hormoscilla sp.]
MNFLTLVLAAISLGITASLVPGLAIASWEGAVIGVIAIVIVMTLANGIAKPILKIIKKPENILTLSLMRFALIAIGLLLAGYFTNDYFIVKGLVPAFLGAIVLSVVYGSIDWFVSGEEA